MEMKLQLRQGLGRSTGRLWSLHKVIGKMFFLSNEKYKKMFFLSNEKYKILPELKMLRPKRCLAVPLSVFV
jgi:hypothetical protein